jgi:hypothetical protein
MSGHEDRGAKGTMPAGCHSANMLAANTDAHPVSTDLPGAWRWYRICHNRHEGRWTAASRHNDPAHVRQGKRRVSLDRRLKCSVS